MTYGGDCWICGGCKSTGVAPSFRVVVAGVEREPHPDEPPLLFLPTGWRETPAGVRCPTCSSAKEM